MVRPKNGLSGKPVQPFENIQFTLREAEMPTEFGQFRETGRLTFAVPITDQRFLGLAQVIATSFTIAIPGAVTGNNELYAILRHNGSAAFLDVNGNEFDFSHSEVTALYKYGLQSGKYIAGGNLGGDNDEYIGLSPFATWTIELPARFNPGLALGAADEISIAFSGRALPMHPDARLKLMGACGGRA